MNVQVVLMIILATRMHCKLEEMKVKKNNIMLPPSSLITKFSYSETSQMRTKAVKSCMLAVFIAYFRGSNR
jgi:hypothetical protein